MIHLKPNTRDKLRRAWRYSSPTIWFMAAVGYIFAMVVHALVGDHWWFLLAWALAGVCLRQGVKAEREYRARKAVEKWLGSVPIRERGTEHQHTSRGPFHPGCPVCNPTVVRGDDAEHPGRTEP